MWKKKFIGVVLGVLLVISVAIAGRWDFGRETLLTDAELTQLQAIGAATISANQWAMLGGVAETLAAGELDILDGVTGVTPAEISYIGDVTGLLQNQIDAKAPSANPTHTGTITIGSAGVDETDPDNSDIDVFRFQVDTDNAFETLIIEWDNLRIDDDTMPGACS